MTAAAISHGGGAREATRLWQILLYAVLLAPISVGVGLNTVSANYLFAALLLGPRYVSNPAASRYVVFMTLSFLIGVIVFSRMDGDFLLRQGVSFGLALLSVCLLFTRLNVRVDEFVSAVVLAGVVYSLIAIYMVATKGFSITDIYVIKGGLREYVTDWPQRYSVLLVFAFCVTVSRWSRGLLWHASSLIILMCIFLTFTRSAWLAVVVGMLTYLVTRGGAERARSKKGARKGFLHFMIGLALFSALLVFAVRNEAIYGAFQLFFENLILSTESVDVDDEGSEGARLSLWVSLLNVLSANPLTGTGFAGTHLVVQGAGSAHSQYIDVLLRTGVIGLMIYLWFWKKLFAFFRHADRGVLAGLVAIFVFGFFHETTKLSYGALIFFVLLNKVYEEARSRAHRHAARHTPESPACAGS